MMAFKQIISTLYIFICCSSVRAQQKLLKMIEWRSDESGLFAHVLRLAEWMYCVKADEDYGLYINMHGCYGCPTNSFLTYFKDFEDSQIVTRPSGLPIAHYFTDFPGRCIKEFKKHSSDGMRNYNAFNQFVYQNIGLFKDPDFAVYRQNMHPIISSYFQPVDALQERVGFLMQQMEYGVNEKIVKIGIHARAKCHFRNYTKSDAQFVDDLERDIDEIMRIKNPEKTRIYLATLLQPVVDRIASKYLVTVAPIPRTSNVNKDWDTIHNIDPLDIGRDAIVDAWCLSQCDEVWGGQSNVVIMASLLNPKLSIRILPSLEAYDGF